MASCVAFSLDMPSLSDMLTALTRHDSESPTGGDPLVLHGRFDTAEPSSARTRDSEDSGAHGGLDDRVLQCASKTVLTPQS